MVKTMAADRDGDGDEDEDEDGDGDGVASKGRVRIGLLLAVPRVWVTKISWSMIEMVVANQENRAGNNLWYEPLLFLSVDTIG
jgi:hypothetical protein